MVLSNASAYFKRFSEVRRRARSYPSKASQGRRQRSTRHFSHHYQHERLSPLRSRSTSAALLAQGKSQRDITVSHRNRMSSPHLTHTMHDYKMNCRCATTGYNRRCAQNLIFTGNLDHAHTQLNEEEL